MGLPRSGSTLLEQILGSHSAIEALGELGIIPDLVRGLRDRFANVEHPEVMALLDAADCDRLGNQYIERILAVRKLDQPFFTDKSPGNFTKIGLIHLLLPNAKIIDARRHPLGCCFSNFRQHYARGQVFSHSLTDLGRAWRDYARLMAHFDAVLPCKVYRVFYEELVASPEREIRRLLDHLGLPFEEKCLRFYENPRYARTASAEQVRKPISNASLDHWRNYEPWLGPLKEALGPVLDAYPDVPAF